MDRGRSIGKSDKRKPARVKLAGFEVRGLIRVAAAIIARGISGELI